MSDDLVLLINWFPSRPPFRSSRKPTNNVWGNSLDPLLDRSEWDGQSVCVRSSQQKKASLEDLSLSSLRPSSSSSTSSINGSNLYAYEDRRIAQSSPFSFLKPSTPQCHMDPEKGTTNGERQTPLLSTDTLGNDPTPASDHIMGRVKKPSMWRRMVGKLGLSLPVVLMMVKYVVPRMVWPPWGTTIFQR